jgi:hypothetical protein
MSISFIPSWPAMSFRIGPKRGLPWQFLTKILKHGGYSRESTDSEGSVHSHRRLKHARTTEE